MDTFISILQTIGIILIVILSFNIMIFVHELGHFLAGKWRGAYIDRFQIWFGKPLWSKKIRGVEWGVGWIPAGGFVSLPQLEGMEGIEGTSNLPEGLKPLTAKDKVIIAAAGMAAHLPGMCAAMFPLPVIGVPIKSSTMDGLDSLLSTVQMPSGVPVACVAINGAKNAAILAVQMLGTGCEEARNKIRVMKEEAANA